MPNGDQPVIRGTVIERSFVAGDVATVLFAATAPLDEISARAYEEDDNLLRRTLGQLVGVPTSTIIDEADYAHFAEYFAVEGRRFSPLLPFEEWWKIRESRFDELTSEMRLGGPSIRHFAEHSIALFASTTGAGDRFLWDPYVGIWHPLKRGLERLELDEDAVRVGAACLSARLARTSKMAAFTENVLEYELPFGRSPKTSSDSLLKLLESGKKMCLAPIVAGSTFGVTQLSQGQYVAALLSAGTGSAMTLILLSGVAIGSLLISHVAHRRTGDDERD